MRRFNLGRVLVPNNTPARIWSAPATAVLWFKVTTRCPPSRQGLAYTPRKIRSIYVGAGRGDGGGAGRRGRGRVLSGAKRAAKVAVAPAGVVAGGKGADGGQGGRGAGEVEPFACVPSSRRGLKRRRHDRESGARLALGGAGADRGRSGDSGMGGGGVARRRLHRVAAAGWIVLGPGKRDPTSSPGARWRPPRSSRSSRTRSSGVARSSRSAAAVAGHAGGDMARWRGRRGGGVTANDGVRWTGGSGSGGGERLCGNKWW